MVLSDTSESEAFLQENTIFQLVLQNTKRQIEICEVSDAHIYRYVKNLSIEDMLFVEYLMCGLVYES